MSPKQQQRSARRVCSTVRLCEQVTLFSFGQICGHRTALTLIWFISYTKWELPICLSHRTSSSRPYLRCREITVCLAQYDYRHLLQYLTVTSAPSRGHRMNEVPHLSHLFRLSPTHISVLSLIDFTAQTFLPGTVFRSHEMHKNGLLRLMFP